VKREEEKKDLSLCGGGGTVDRRKKPFPFDGRPRERKKGVLYDGDDGEERGEILSRLAGRREKKVALYRSGERAGPLQEMDRHQKREGEEGNSRYRGICGKGGGVVQETGGGRTQDVHEGRPMTATTRKKRRKTLRA